MGKKLTVGKLFGIIFCIIGTAAACVLLGYNFYLGGQMKLVDKYLKAIARQDFTSFVQCYAAEYSEKISEEDMASEKSMGNKLADPEEFKATAEFQGREKLGDGRYMVYFDLTVYNDDEHHTTENVVWVVVRDNGKWVLEAEE